jgi:hypothetical protein
MRLMRIVLHHILCRLENKIIMTALYEVIFNSDIALLRRLLEQGADIEACNAYHQTALHLAAAKGDSAMMHLLRSYHANLEARADYGHRPLMLAASTRCYWKQDHVCCAAVNTLLPYYPDLHAQDNYGWSALHHAAYDGYALTVTQLLEAGSPLKQKNAQGHTALMLAVSRAQAHPLNERETFKPTCCAEDKQYAVIQCLLAAYQAQNSHKHLHWRQRQSLRHKAQRYRCPEVVALF